MSPTFIVCSSLVSIFTSTLFSLSLFSSCLPRMSSSLISRFSPVFESLAELISYADSLPPLLSF